MTTVKEELQRSLKKWVSANIVQFVDELSTWLHEEGFSADRHSLSFKCCSRHEGYSATIIVEFWRSRNFLCYLGEKSRTTMVEVKLLRGIAGKSSPTLIIAAQEWEIKEWAIREDTQLTVVLDDIKRYVRSLPGRNFGREDGEG